MTALPIVHGRQQPAHGSRRAQAMTYVKAWLLKHGAGKPPTIADDLGYSINRVREAVDDLRYFDPDVVVSIPAPGNGYVVSLRWVDIYAGELNQLRHYRTRADGLAIRHDKMADRHEREGEPAKAALMRDAAEAFRAEVVRVDVLIAKL